MSSRKIIRAWRDEDYRLTLSEAERAQLPAHPSAMIELTDPQLGVVSGGIFTSGCTWGLECYTYRCATLVCHTSGCPQ